MKNRTLSLRADSLGALTTDELGSVVGAMPASGLPCLLDAPALTDLCPTWDCTGCHVTC